MALVLLYRLAVVASPTAYRVVKWAEGPGVAQLPAAVEARLRDPSESDADLTAAVAAATDRLSDVTTFSGSFSLRKLQVVFSYAGGSPGGEDSRVVTFHFVKLSAGAPVDTWAAADFIAMETAFDTYWASLKDGALSTLTHAQYRWYKAGPNDVPPQAPVRVVDRAITGTATATGGQKQIPQCAISVTEKTSIRKAWGRVYWPLNYAPIGDAGRLIGSFQTIMANATDVFYEAALSGSTPIVVYSAAKPERLTKAKKTLPAIGARAITVDETQVDDIPDVIRSRRHSAPLLRIQRQVGT